MDKEIRDDNVPIFMALPDIPDPIINLPLPPQKKAQDYLDAYSSWTYAAIGAIAQEVASIELHLYKQIISGGKPDTKEVYEHESLSLLYHVNDFYTRYDLIEGTQIYLELVGEAFWVMLYGAKGEAELWLMRPDWVTIVPDKKEYIKGYRYFPGGAQMGSEGIFFPRNDVIHFKYFNPVNPYRGKGTVQAAAMAIDTDTFSAEWNRNFFFNSAIPGTIISTDAKIPDDKRKRFVEQFRQEFMGRRNAHKVALFTGGSYTVNQTTTSAKDMDFTEQRHMMRDDILATFKVPKTVLGMSDDVNRANAVATTSAFMERVITPRMRKFVAHLSEFYLRHWSSEKLFFDFDDPAPEDVELNLKIYKSALGGEGGVPWMTINEVRQRENLEPLDGGDDLYLPFQFTVNRSEGEESGEEKQAQVVLKGKPAKPKQRKMMMPIPPASLYELRKRAVESGIKHDLAKLVSQVMKIKDIENFEDKGEVFWKQMVAKTDVLEEVMRGQLAPLFAAQETEVLRNLEDPSFKHTRKGNRKNKAVTDLLFDVDAETQAWIKQFEPFITGIMIDKGREILDWLGISAELDLSTQRAIDYLRREGLSFAKGVNETTIEELKKTLGQGIAEGEGVDALKKRVETVFTSANGPRAEAIARTEVLRSSNFATLEAYKQSGIIKKKVWYTAMDERVCPVCGPIHGKEVSVGSKFSGSNGERTEAPPIHPNCRCTIIAGIL